MRRIATLQDLEKKKKRNTLYLSIFMLAILVLSTVGYAFIYNSDSSQPEAPAEVSGKFSVEFEGQTFYLTNTKEMTMDVPVEITNNLNNYVGVPVYITGKNPSVLIEIYSVLGKYSSKISEACYGPCEEDLPEKDCSENLIVWKDSTENKVYQQENCIFIEGDLRSVDSFLYKIMGL